VGTGKAWAVLEHSDIRMNAKKNRDDLSLWDMGKRPLYGSERESVQAATLCRWHHGKD